MPEKIKVALQIPHSDPAKNNRSFSFRLKQQLANELSVSKRTKSIFVVSDIGGDFQNFCKILIKAKIIDSALNWVFGEGRLVILGNCLDNNKDMLECLWLIYGLEEKAKHKEGYLHFILGNNELENINGNWRFRHPRYAMSDNIAGNASTALYDGSNELWRWMKTKNLVERIGHILFVHGSVSAKLLYSGLSIEEINNLARFAISRDTRKLLKSPTVSDFFSGTNENAEYSPEDYGEQKIDNILKHFRAKMIISGYRAAERIDSFQNEKMINVYVNHTNDESQGLLIKGRHCFRIKSDGKGEKIL